MMLPLVAALLPSLPSLVEGELAAHARLDFRVQADGTSDASPSTVDADRDGTSDLDVALDEAVPAYGTARSTRWTAQAAVGMNVESHEETIILGGMGLEHFVADGLSLDLQLNGFDAHQDGPDAGAVHFALLLRWHAVRRGTWSFFLDGGGGLSYATDNIPATGSYFNLTPQAGFGFSFALPRDLRLLVGAKWFHVSNANTRESNPGLDTVMFWTGLSLPF